MKEITAIFRNSKDSEDQHQQEEFTFFSNELEDYKLSDDSILQDSEKTVIYYIARYIAERLAKEKCTDCNEMFSPGQVQLSISVESDETDLSATHDTKLEFVEQISRGSLAKPSDFIYISCVHASALNRFIVKNENLRKSLLATKNPRKTFIESFMKVLENEENTEGLLNLKCRDMNKIILSVKLHSPSLISTPKTSRLS